MDAKGAPKDAKDTFKDAKDAPEDAKDAPKDAKDTLKDAKDAPKDAKDPPKDARGAPKDAKDTPKDAEKTTRKDRMPEGVLPTHEGPKPRESERLLHNFFVGADGDIAFSVVVGIRMGLVPFQGPCLGHSIPNRHAGEMLFKRIPYTHGSAE